MKETFMTNWSKQMKKGLLIFFVMNVIKKKSSYGYEIIQQINEDNEILIADGTLYPLLKQLKKEQLVLSKWETNEENAPRKYYYLTGKGNSILNEMKTYWLTLSKLVNISIENN